ncbi:MAG: hypothetical protein U5K74_05995 [Gemmatimonadaceae bacterium]|nr:hypothetical protein [Gemmatimonadaceae bacterium]
MKNPTFIVDAVTRFAEVRASGEVAVAIELAPWRLTCHRPSWTMCGGALEAPRRVGAARAALARTERSQAVSGSRSLTMAATPLALSDLRALLGPDRVRLVRA